MSSAGYHEPVEKLSAATRDMHRAIVSLREELEAIDCYNQRADSCDDPVLKAILEHNRDEEKEHAAMLMEWIRRNDPRFSRELRGYLFTETPIVHEQPGPASEGGAQDRFVEGRWRKVSGFPDTAG